MIQYSTIRLQSTRSLTYRAPIYLFCAAPTIFPTAHASFDRTLAFRSDPVDGCEVTHVWLERSMGLIAEVCGVQLEMYTYRREEQEGARLKCESLGVE